MSNPTVHALVNDEGVAVIPPDEVAALGAHPGDELALRLVTTAPASRRNTKPTPETLRGALQLARRVPAKAFDTASRRAAVDAEAGEWPS